MATKDYKVTITDQQNEYTFSAKKKNAIYIKGINQNDIDTNSFRIDGDNLLFSAKGKDFVVSNYTGIKYIKTDNALGKTELLDIISHSYVDNTANVINLLEKPYYNKSKLAVTGTNYNDKIDLSESGYEPIGKTNIKKNRGLTITGGNGNDEITGTDYNDTIKGGNGNDTIEGGLGADTITGGAGKNIIVVKNTEFGNDTINLTKNEELVIDLTDCTDITDLSDLKYSIIGKNLIITVPEDDEYNKGTLTLKNYTKNILKSLSFKLYAQDTIIYNNLTKFTNDVVFNYNNSNLSKKRVLTGSAYNDKIDVENTTTKKYTINAGNGKNDITISSGTNVINSGKDNDTINISLDGNYTVNAGAGENTINIDNSDEFGTVIINEQKVNATNTIVLSNELINPEYKRVKNDMYIVDNNGTIILKNYYSNVKNKSFINITIKGDEKGLSDYLSEQTTEISGSGKINGTDSSDIVTITGKAATTINTGKGNDIIGYSKGNRTIYLYEGDGEDIVEAGEGTDTIRFQNGTKVSAEIQYDTEGNTNLVIHYGNKGDTITFKDYNSKTKLYYYIGKQKYSLFNIANDGELIEIDKFKTHYDGTNKNDRIMDSLVHTLENSITINAFAGNDYIDAHHDIVHAGAGNDYVHSIDSFVYGEDGNDTIINYGSTSGGSEPVIEIYGGDGDDIIFNERYSSVKNIYGNEGEDIIINSGNISFDLDGGYDDDQITLNSGSIVKGTTYGGSGNDKITVQSNVTINDLCGDTSQDTTSVDGDDKIEISGTVRNVYTSGGNDEITVNTSGKVAGSIYGGDGKDIIVNRGIIDVVDNNTNLITANITSHSIYGGDGDDDIKNYGTVRNDIQCGAGNDIVLNKGTVSNINGNVGDDTITNNGTVSNIYGDGGNDTIINNGTAGDIHGGASNDTIYTGENSSAGKISFERGDGHDTLYLNAAVNNLSFNNDVDKICYWDKNDLIISYNNGSDSVTIKNYNPIDEDVAVNINGLNLSTVVSDYIDMMFNRIIINNRSISYKISGSKGDDVIINNGTVKNSSIYGDAGDDTITNNGTIDGYIYGGAGDDKIANEVGATASYIYGDGGNDTITNDGTVSNNIDGGAGDDKITNEIGATASYIYGDGGNDTITNDGTVKNNIDGGAGDDKITNNGTIDGYIDGGAGNDTIYTGVNSSAKIILFVPGYGHDTLYLNAAVNNLSFNDDVDKICYWDKNDLIISNNNGNDSVTIKNYNPIDEDVAVNINGLNLSTVVSDYLDKGFRIIINSRSISYKISGSEGDDVIINNGTVKNSSIYGDAGDDTITNNGTIDGYIYGGAGDDKIANEVGATASYIYGDGGNDTITNDGTVSSIYGGGGNDTITNNGTIDDYIDGDDGNDTITNNGTIDDCIDGDDGNDTITNNGTIDGNIYGGYGNDTITNNGTIDGYIYGGAGNDTIYTGENSSAEGISFTNVDGHDTLYLNAKINNLTFNSSLYIDGYTWNGDDLVIEYSNSAQQGSVTIKNYNPLDNNIKVYIGINYKNYRDLATMVPKKPTTQTMSLGTSNTGINDLYYQVATFTSASSTDMQLNYTPSDTNDISVVMSEYTNTDLEGSL